MCADTVPEKGVVGVMRGLCAVCCRLHGEGCAPPLPATHFCCQHNCVSRRSFRSVALSVWRGPRGLFPRIELLLSLPPRFQVLAMCLATIGASHPFTTTTQRRVDELSRRVPFSDSSDRPLTALALHPHDIHVSGIAQRAEQLCERCWRAGHIARCCHPCGWSICDACFGKVRQC